jgi:branched-chain amino acid transport system permease protein
MDVLGIIQGALSGLLLAAVYILVALGLTVVFSLLRIINFAHGEFYMLGAIATYYLFAQWGLPYPLVVVIIALGSIFFGLAVERAIFRQFHRDLLGAFVLSLGLAWVLQMSALKVFGTFPQGLPNVIEGVTELGGVRITNDRILVISVGILLVGAISFFVLKTQTGRAMRAVAQNRDVAALVGINPTQTATVGFVLGAVLAAVAGALIGPIFSVHAEMGVALTIKAFIIIIVGGMGSLPGAALAAFVLGMFEGIGGLFVSNAELTVVEFVAVMALLVLRPHGLMGAADA